MAVLNPSDLKHTAAQRLSEASFHPRNLVLIHTGVLVALNLIVNGLHLYLTEMIGTTGGLGGLGLRSVLQTAQTVLSYITTFFTPFWTAGLLFSMVSIIRGQEAGPGSLFRGFRRFGSLLSYTLWEVLIYLFLCMGLFYVITFLYLMTPLAAPFLAQMEELLMNPEMFLADGTVNVEALPLDALYPTMLPLVLLFAAVAIPVAIWVSYHFRMGPFLLVESIPRGAFGAFFVSSRLMKGHKWQMAKLDLSFWWFYLIEGILVLVLYLDVILANAGIPLPLDPVPAFFVTIALHGVLQLALHWWKKADVDATYAAAYEAIFREAVPADPSQSPARKL